MRGKKYYTDKNCFAETVMSGTMTNKYDVYCKWNNWLSMNLM